MRGRLTFAGITVAWAAACANVEDPGRDMRAAVDRFFEAASGGDWDRAAVYMAPEFRIFTDGAATFDRPAYVALLKADDLKVAGVSLSEIETDVAGDGSMGWIRYKAVVRATSNGRPADVRTAETMVLVRRPEGWRIVQAHASVAPLEPDRGG